MRYSLVRTRDGAGDSGPMCLGLVPDATKTKIESTEDNVRPRVGIALRVGSPYGRTFSAQDYWTTTIITEILEESQDYVRFRTGNSEYEWKRF